MGTLEAKKLTRLKRKKRIRKKITGTTEQPRLCVFRSAKHIYAQIIDDREGRTLVAAGSVEKNISQIPDLKGKLAVAAQVGKTVGQRAVEQGIRKVVFDRNGFLYHGRVKAVAEGAREAGLSF